ncbi:MAG: formylglycine-generating enzyme family protein, partial [Methanosarcinaceae archaeon]|nr:formylglycine-generating enzyme family protein [Methanosarcinaceae archaeon]
IGSTVRYREHKGEKHTFEMQPKEIHCVCPFLKEKSITRSDFLKLSAKGHSAESGVTFKNIAPEKLVEFLSQTCKNRLYKVDEFSVKNETVLYLAGESIGEKAYYLLTAVVLENDGIVQVLLKASSDKPFGLNGFLNEILENLRHLVGSVNSAREIGIIKNEQVINIIDSVVQHTNFSGGAGQASSNIPDSAVQKTNFGASKDDNRKKEAERKSREGPERKNKNLKADEKAQGVKKGTTHFCKKIIDGIGIAIFGSLFIWGIALLLLDWFSSLGFPESVEIVSVIIVVFFILIVARFCLYSGKKSLVGMGICILLVGVAATSFVLSGDSEDGLQEIPPISKTSSEYPEEVASEATAKTNNAQTVPSQNPETDTNSIGMEFVLIPAGEFMMGSNNYYDEEQPVHRVTIEDPFYLGKFEVTQEQWIEVMGRNPSNFKGDDLPVEKISWNDAQEFIERLNRMEETDKYRLPSEAEWEYACRAGTTTGYYFGNAESELWDYGWYSTSADEFGNYGNSLATTEEFIEDLAKIQSGMSTSSIGQKKPNPWGLYDMYGNVWEWCQDKYHLDYEGAPSDGSAWESGSISSRVARGGCWLSEAGSCRSATRIRLDPDGCGSDVGFRLLIEL